LAYKIKKNRKGYYTLMNIDAPAEAVVKMERLMRLDENLLRYLTIKVDVLEEGPSAMLETKGRKAKVEDKYEIEIAEGE
jgi:small subunit ribosomal protein S6